MHTVLVGSVIVGGISLAYWFARKKDQVEIHGFFDQGGAYYPIQGAERRTFLHQPYGHWCYAPDPTSPFKDLESSARKNGECERRLNMFLPSNWTEDHVEHFVNQPIN